MSITPIFTVIQLKHNQGSVTADLSINQDSEIFNGHFPGQPVVPGACMLQVVKDILEAALDNTLRLKTAGHLKFISMIDPRITQSIELVITYTVDNGQVTATAQLLCDEAACFKFQGTFIIE
jgi:3-hydroxyacyl-[acyl-carrier-protein] dehydratase